MGSLTGAWLVGMGITAWRQVAVSHKPPVPGTLLAVAGLFAVLGLVADANPNARRTVALVGWGLDIAGLVRLPGTFWAQVSTAQATAAAAETSSTGTPAPAGSGTGLANPGLLQQVGNAALHPFSQQTPA